MNRDKWSTGVRYIVEREKERERERFGQKLRNFSNWLNVNYVPSIHCCRPIFMSSKCGWPCRQIRSGKLISGVQLIDADREDEASGGGVVVCP